jgi:5-methylcytosine-specific restriction endonuclease McrA
MKLVNHISQVEKNIELVEFYACEGTEEEREYILDRIRKGKSLVAYEINKEVRFAPSRFLGYKDNTIKKHETSTIKDGRETNTVLNRVLKTPLEANDTLEDHYIRYCKSLGVEASSYKKRRYWELKLSSEFITNQRIEGLFPEGKIVERTHLARERNSRVLTIAKANFKAKHGKLFCQACGFDFMETYGEEYIEGHHTIPVEKMKPGHKTSPDDIAMLCANCHRMVHKRRPWLSMNQLKDLLKH